MSKAIRVPSRFIGEERRKSAQKTTPVFGMSFFVHSLPASAEYFLKSIQSL
jgi:hypothetical protein